MFKILFTWLNATLFNPTPWFLKRHIKRYALGFSARVLDVGAGDKPYEHLFPKIEEYHTTNTRRHYTINHLPGDQETGFWIQDASCLPFAAQSYDGLLCFQVLSVIAKPERFFMEMQRVLKPGAPVLLSTDFLYPLWSEEDYMRHSIHHLCKLAEENGFEVIQKQSLGAFHALQYSLWVRYFKYYPARIRHMKSLWKLPASLFYLLMLLLSPFIGLLGRIICFFERNITDEFTFTPNQLVYMRKR